MEIEQLISFFKERSDEIFRLLFIAFFGKLLLHGFVSGVLSRLPSGLSDAGFKERANTIKMVLITTGNIILYAIVLFMFLDIVGANITPILTGAGIIGLAVGFGSQALVRDFVSGIFVLIEDQYRVGERIKVGDMIGVVEKITMRSTVLASDKGEMYFISNGALGSITNLSRKKLS